MSQKPLGRKSYGSIGHLPNSRLGPGDHKVTDGQSDICLVKCRDKHDTVIIQEKVDGSNVGVAKLGGDILAITRAGYLASSSPYEQHHLFGAWVSNSKNFMRFDRLLNEGERVCGEWLALAHGTKYELTHEPFVTFDIMVEENRATFDEVNQRCLREGFTMPRLISYGMPMAFKDILKRIEKSGHGAVDPVEGFICRVERQGKVDFLSKWVRQDKQDGKYFKEICGEDVWNWKP